MSTYRFFSLRNGHLSCPAESVECKSDDDAANRAYEKSHRDGLDIEVWEGQRWVTLVKWRQVSLTN